MISLEEMKRLIAAGKWQEWGEAFEHNHKLLQAETNSNVRLVRQLDQLNQQLENLRRWIRYGNVVVDGSAQEPPLRIADITPDETITDADREVPEEER